MCSGALEEGPALAWAGDRVTSSRCKGRTSKGLKLAFRPQWGPHCTANRQGGQCRPVCPWLLPGLSLGLDQPVFHLVGFTKAGCGFQLHEDLNAAWYLKAQRPRWGEQNTSLYTVLFTKNQMKKMELHGAWAYP